MMNFAFQVWINGASAVSHEGGHLPFEVDISTLISPSSPNGERLTVAINNTLSRVTLPPGDVQIFTNNPRYPEGYTQQNTHFDFFNFGSLCALKCSLRLHVSLVQLA